jgi:Leucine-rich repeat (LRR) protein
MDLKPYIQGNTLNCIGLNLNEMPNFLNYPDLWYVNFNDNNITEVPDWVGEHKKIHHLNISRNKIKSLPDTLSNTDIEFMEVVENGLEEFPKVINELKNIKELWLHRNNISKFDINIKCPKFWKLCIPGNKILNNHFVINKLEHLLEFDLSDCNLTELPKSINPNNLPNLELIWLHRNNIKSLDLTGFKKMKFLVTSGNKEIKAIIFETENIERLEFNNCNLTSLPENIKDCKKLKVLQLDSNNFTEYPEILNELPELNTIHIRHNKINKFNITSKNNTLIQLLLCGNKILNNNLFIRNCNNLEVLGIASCNLNNNFNNIRTQYPKLKKLWISFNLFTELPHIFGNEINELYLGGNKFKSLELHLSNLNKLWLENMCTLEELDISQCPKLTEINYNNSNNIKHIQLHSNSFQTLEHIKGLELKNISKLNLGSNPWDLAKLKFNNDYIINSLELSHCKLEEYPYQVDILTNLKFLNISHNNIKKIKFVNSTLEDLQCAENKELFEFNISKDINYNLKHLNLCISNINKFDNIIENLNKIERVWLNSSKIKKLKISSNSLKNIALNHTLLEELDIINCLALECLELDNTRLLEPHKIINDYCNLPYNKNKNYIERNWGLWSNGFSKIDYDLISDENMIKLLLHNEYNCSNTYLNNIKSRGLLDNIKIYNILNSEVRKIVIQNKLNINTKSNYNGFYNTNTQNPFLKILNVMVKIYFTDIPNEYKENFYSKLQPKIMDNILLSKNCKENLMKIIYDEEYEKFIPDYLINLREMVLTVLYILDDCYSYIEEFKYINKDLLYKYLNAEFNYIQCWCYEGLFRKLLNIFNYTNHFRVQFTNVNSELLNILTTREYTENRENYIKRKKIIYECYYFDL